MPCCLFAGWAEELRGVQVPRRHGDIDLLYRAPGFAAVDRWLVSGVVEEIAAKRFPHKRAFVCDGVMSELFLVQEDGCGLYTMFWDEVRLDWPVDTFGSPTGFAWPVASTAALASFRQDHHRLSAGRDAYLAQQAANASR